MSLVGALRAGVKAADKVVKSLECDVTYERATGQNEYGTVTFAAAVTLRATVDGRLRQIVTPSGVLSTSRATVLFLDAAALSTATGAAGINDSDKITLPDGTSGPIIAIAGFIDPGTGIPLATEVFLG